MTVGALGRSRGSHPRPVDPTAHQHSQRESHSTPLAQDYEAPQTPSPIMEPSGLGGNPQRTEKSQPGEPRSTKVTKAEVSAGAVSLTHTSGGEGGWEGPGRRRTLLWCLSLPSITITALCEAVSSITFMQDSLGQVLQTSTMLEVISYIFLFCFLIQNWEHQQVNNTLNNSNYHNATSNAIT